jgi:hypothetical protein
MSNAASVSSIPFCIWHNNNVTAVTTIANLLKIKHIIIKHYKAKIRKMSDAICFIFFSIWHKNFFTAICWPSWNYNQEFSRISHGKFKWDITCFRISEDKNHCWCPNLVHLEWTNHKTGTLQSVELKIGQDPALAQIFGLKSFLAQIFGLDISVIKLGKKPH